LLNKPQENGKDHLPGGKMKKTIKLIAVAAVLFAPFINASEAANKMDISASIDKECYIENVEDMNFGQYSFEKDSEAKASFSIRCNQALEGVVGIDLGLHSADGVRQLKGPELLAYNLYTSGFDSMWDNAKNKQTLKLAGGLEGNKIVVAGRIPKAQYKQAGAYNDTVTIALEY
jgi:spore coat protein U-like protein